MRTLEELRSAVSTRGSMRRSVSAAQILDLIAHVRQQAEQIATLTARVAALEASEAERAIDRMVARRTGPGRPMVSAGKVQTPAKLDEAPRAMPGDPTVRHVVAWMRATYPQNAHAQEWAGEIERVFLSHVAPSAKLDEAPLGVGAKVLIPGEVVAVDTDGSLRVRYSAMGSDAYHAWCRAEQVRPEPAAPPPPANTSLTCVLCRSVEPQEGRVHTIRRHGKGHTSCDCAPAAPPPPAAPAPASDDYEARARHHLETLLRVPGGLEPYEGDVMDLAALLRGVADEAAAKAVGKARREEQAACEAVCREVAEECRPHSQIKTHVATVCADRIAARGKDEFWCGAAALGGVVAMGQAIHDRIETEA